MLRQVGLLAALWIGCGRSVEAPSYPDPVPLGTRHVAEGHASDTPPPRTLGRRAHYQMRQQLSDLRFIEELLVAGRLDDARALADRLPPDHGSVAASRSTEATFGDARAADIPPSMMHATTIAEASRIAARLTVGCGGCHQRAGARVAVAVEPAPPAGDPTQCSPRHRWAIDRLADGLTGAHDRPWRAGLDAFATAPLTGPGAPQHERVQAIAREALARFATDTWDARAATYSDLLATCGSCHATAREQTRHGREVL
jgi:hypothetical protein